MQRYAMDAKAEFGQDAWAVERKSNIGAYVLKADAEATIARLTAERDEALATAAAAYERAAQWHDDVAAHDQSGIDYSDAVGVPISNRAQLAESVKQHEYSAREIRALATEADTTALAEMLDAETRARPLDEWHEDMGDCVWWCWQDGTWLGEPAMIGNPLDNAWPGYHTHFTPHPAFPARIDQRKEAE